MTLFYDFIQISHKNIRVNPWLKKAH